MKTSHFTAESHVDPDAGSWLQRLLACLFVVLLAIAACYAAAEEPDRGGGPKPLALKPYMGALRTVSVKIGALELPFVFDTAGGDTFVTPAVASAVDCRPYGRLVGFRMSGERIDSPRCGRLSLRLAGVDREVEVAVFDIMSLLPDGWPELGGIVSLHTFRGLQITVDLAHERVTLETPASFARTISGMKRLSSRIASQSGGESVDLFVEVAAQQGSLWFELDSGNLDKVLIAPHALKQLGVTGMRPEGAEMTLELVGYGPITVEAAEREMIYDGLLNAATMAQLELALDLETGAAWATGSPPPAAEP